MSHFAQKVVGFNLAPRSSPRQPTTYGVVARCGSRPDRLKSKIRVASRPQESPATHAKTSSQPENSATQPKITSEPEQSTQPSKSTKSKTEKAAKTSEKLERDEQIELLRRARAKSEKWMDQATQLRSSDGAAEKQAMMYKQLAASRNRLSSRLSEANKYVSFMESRLEESTTTVKDAHDSTQKVLRELGTLSRMVETAAAAVKFGVDKEEAVEKLLTLQSRIELAHEAVDKEQRNLDAIVPRRVPVSWYGVALDVRVMGSFDNWTKGFDLSPEEMSDNVLSEFTADLLLLPGTYEVKFVVNGEWKTAPDWPTVTTSTGDTNNVITVD